MNKENKQELVAEMHDKLQRAQAVFLADFRGMNVGQATELRNELRKANAEYKVVKNTLLEIASKGTDKEGLSQYYAGPTAIALCYDDPVAAAKVLSRFNKENTNPFTLKAGVLTGKTINVAEIQALADLPSREVLIAKMLGSMQAPASNFVRVLAAVPGGFVRALEQIRIQKAA
ncbi:MULTISPECIES: 50S ribosomal protein L10 [Geomonas]|uniref:Large ribosomal subunit protein uL10 n=3 Tax=Geomonas TaxID=2651583 RepID=A0A6V8N3H1_9BACT|nr:MULTISPECIES: 50S ribosomal protein L10 [Geomonas]MBU5615169.1 50S ribosomal protein L10 [Geomonas azotofigens]MBU5638333.1 50S ribosomal protein L10 [Geomonas diazotrophica]QWV92607.1 50S ribosomal protein L10 [Geomonas oryzisoli]QWV96664.1 50S ribosomal protein L10 [Geomonas nitrogeniifigens]QXE85767.1 50S ribosomal protein L10 [Geomonas nitrogeniifigens]